MKLSLAQELLLLALKDEKGTLAVESMFLRHGLAGALLLELLFEGRLAIVDKKVKLIDGSTHPDPFLEGTLVYIRESKKERKLKDWVKRLAEKQSKLVREMTTSLVAAGILQHEEGKILWVFPHHTYPTNDPTPELLIRRRIDDVILGGSTPDDRTSALISLALACRLAGELFEKDVRRDAKKRMKEIAKSNQGGAAAVKQAIEDVEAAVIVILGGA